MSREKEEAKIKTEFCVVEFPTCKYPECIGIHTGNLYACRCKSWHRDCPEHKKPPPQMAGAYT